MSVVHYVSKKGKRKSNEDKHTIYSNLDGAESPSKPRVNFYGVYDGHGGRFVSTYLANNLPGCFVHQKIVYPLNKNYVNGIYDAIENELYTRYAEHATDCGSTCLAVCHYRKDGKEYLDVMNTGDSRLVGCNRSFIAVQMTIDHKPNTPLERRRLQQLGAKLNKELWNDRGDWRINDLSVSRAFGDKASERYVISRPDMFTHRVSDNLRFIILACDGLWDVVSNQEAVDIVIDTCYDKDFNFIVSNDKAAQNVAEKLACFAIEDRGSTDNVTAIVVFFD